MSKYTMSDVKKVDRLWSKMSQREVSEKTGIPRGTISYWANQGLISTDANHRQEYDAQTVQRVDELYDVMPLPEVAELLGIPLKTLYWWQSKGLITSKVDWQSQQNGAEKKAPAQRVVDRALQDDTTYKEVAKKFGIHHSTVSNYVRQYRNGDL
jgi:DNA-binding transcriptional MerR regulator